MTTAREQGREAYSDEKDLKDNPFPIGSDEHKDWKKGFQAAERDDPFAPHNLFDE